MSNEKVQYGVVEHDRVTFYESKDAAVSTLASASRGWYDGGQIGPEPHITTRLVTVGFVA